MDFVIPGTLENAFREGLSDSCEFLPLNLNGEKRGLN